MAAEHKMGNNFLYGTPPSKKAVFAAGKGCLGWYKPFGDDKCLSFKILKGKPVVDLRRYQCHLTPDMEAVYDYPTRTGVNLSTNQYLQLKKELPAILDEIRRRENGQENRDLAFHLGNGDFLSMSRQYNNVSVRKFCALVDERTGEPREPTKDEQAVRFFIDLGNNKYLRAFGKCIQPVIY